jgi:hypothetical protein
MPLYPSIMLRAKERALTLCSSDVFSLGLTFESLKELGGLPFATTGTPATLRAHNFVCKPLIAMRSKEKL